MAATPIDLNGIWKYDWDSQVLDDVLARARGYLRCKTPEMIRKEILSRLTGSCQRQ